MYYLTINLQYYCLSDQLVNIKMLSKTRYGPFRLHQTSQQSHNYAFERSIGRKLNCTHKEFWNSLIRCFNTTFFTVKRSLMWTFKIMTDSDDITGCRSKPDSFGSIIFLSWWRFGSWSGVFNNLLFGQFWNRMIWLRT